MFAPLKRRIHCHCYPAQTSDELQFGEEDVEYES